MCLEQISAKIEFCCYKLKLDGIAAQLIHIHIAIKMVNLQGFKKTVKI